MRVDLTEQATRDLTYFIEDQNLVASLAPMIVSEILSHGLSQDRDRWADRFGNQLLEEQ